MQCLILLMIRLRKIRFFVWGLKIKAVMRLYCLCGNCKERQVILSFFFCLAAANAENFKDYEKKKTKKTLIEHIRKTPI